MIRTVIALHSVDATFPPQPWSSETAIRPWAILYNRIVAKRSGSLDADSIAVAVWPDTAAAKAGISEISSDYRLAFAAEVSTRKYKVGGNPSNGPVPAGAHKVMFAYRLPEGIDPDWFWHYHTEIHGPEVVAAGGDLIVGYSLSRQIRTLAGHANFFALIELWWKNEGAIAAYAERSATYVTQSGKAPLEDWASHKPISDFSLQLVEAAS